MYLIPYMTKKMLKYDIEWHMIVRKMILTCFPICVSSNNACFSVFAATTLNGFFHVGDQKIGQK